jgi:hypothetical protein
MGEIDHGGRLTDASLRIGDSDNGTLPKGLRYDLAHDFLLIVLVVAGLTDAEFAARSCGANAEHARNDARRIIRIFSD